ncbi:MAG TPA: asparagine synthase-related protein [Steroidobacteraceae bacterium]|nr:asparagine synthase-related protein [Steroidobacteraceae bacterium]
MKAWGRYVAVLREARTGVVRVLRDPTGTLPCFVTQHERVHVVFSDVESCLSLGIRFSVNWRYIAAYVPYSALQIRATGLNEVTEVQPGECLTIAGGTGASELLWSPLDARRRGLIEDPVSAAAMVRETVRVCVHAWASRHRSVVHNLSGGLDSSIVLSCVVNAPSRPQITCVHYFAPASGEDERKYARLAASHFQAELVECPLDATALDLQKLLSIRYSPRPWFYIYDLEQGPLEAQIAASHGATSIFSGASGDGLFMQARAELAIADYLRIHGWRPRLLRIALDAARITRTSLWQVLRQGIARHLKRPIRSSLSELDTVRTLVPREVFAAARDDDSLIHPWLAGVRGIPPGLRWHILCVSIPPAFYSAFADGPLERTAVLFSQPLIELCLRIPSYVWTSGGTDRSVARAAFAQDLPPPIIRRTQKGAIDRHNLRLMHKNQAFLREMLLDGLLVRHGLLDRTRLEEFLGGDSTPPGFEYNEVLRQHLCTEVWLRRWTALTNPYGC